LPLDEVDESDELDEPDELFPLAKALAVPMLSEDLVLSIIVDL
jgi:hypothetical protein